MSFFSTPSPPSHQENVQNPPLPSIDRGHVIFVNRTAAGRGRSAAAVRRQLYVPLDRSADDSPFLPRGNRARQQHKERSTKNTI